MAAWRQFRGTSPQPSSAISNLKARFDCFKLRSIVLVQPGYIGEDVKGSTVIFGAKSTEMNCASIVLNYADITFNSAGPHLDRWEGGFWRFEHLVPICIHKVNELHFCCRCPHTIADFSLETVSINWVLIELNYSVPISYHIGHLSETHFFEIYLRLPFPYPPFFLRIVLKWSQSVGSPASVLDCAAIIIVSPP